MKAILFQSRAGIRGVDFCSDTLLVAFESVKAAHAWGTSIQADMTKEVWLCAACGRYHAHYGTVPPSGATSGTGRPHCPEPTMVFAKTLAVKEAPRIERPA
jgi:hypothetical protein